MHDIEPYHRWREYYIASEDEASPFFGRQYDEYYHPDKMVYNYILHPEWDDFGSDTLYLKILFVEYDEGYAIIELIGEWNDCLHNDIMYLKRDVIDLLIKKDIYKFILIAENVLNFHGSEEDYYEEWYDDIKDESGWICILNTLNHVTDEMKATRLEHYVNFGDDFVNINWRPNTPKRIFQAVEALIQGGTKRLREY